MKMEHKCVKEWNCFFQIITLGEGTLPSVMKCLRNYIIGDKTVFQIGRKAEPFFVRLSRVYKRRRASSALDKITQNTRRWLTISKTMKNELPVQKVDGKLIYLLTKDYC
jgi:hypothetical protein